MLDGVIITPLTMVEVPGGDILHVMTQDASGFDGFGEAYFSQIKPDVIKGWKRHRKMTLNLVVPLGNIRFVLFDDREESSSYGKFQEVILSRDNYCRLTVPPMMWMAFQGIDEITSMVLNIANIMHLPDESDRKNLDEIEYDWSTVS